MFTYKLLFSEWSRTTLEYDPSSAEIQIFKTSLNRFSLQLRQAASKYQEAPIIQNLITIV
jgi:hypothetical protein